MSPRPAGTVIRRGESVVVSFPLSLGQVLEGDMVSLSVEQQRQQMSHPFEKFGMHWLLTIEKKQSNPKTQEFNISVFLYCLSVALDVDNQDMFPLKGAIPVLHEPQDGRPRYFDATTGVACDLVGKNFPANAVQMKEFIVSLASGRTESNTAISIHAEDEADGFYNGKWTGAGADVLCNHTFEPTRDGAAIEISLTFDGTPKPLVYVE